MLILILLLSVLLTTILVGVGLYLVFSKDTVRKPPDPNVSNDSKVRDELPDLWMKLGYADDAPNVRRAITAGWAGTGTILRYIAYRQDWDETLQKFLPITGDRYKGESEIDYLVRKKLGKRRFGYPIINSLKPLDIDRVVKVDTSVIHDKTKNPDADQAPKILSMLSAKKVRRYGLYEEITRPTFHEYVDTKDGVRFSAISTLIIDSTDPRPIFEKYPDSFLQNISEIVLNFFSAKVIKMEWEEYKAFGEHGHKFVGTELGDLQDLLKPYGVEIKLFTISDPELHPAIQKQFDERAGATANAQKTGIDAEAAAKAAETKSRGEAAAIRNVGKATAEANRMRFEELVSYYVTTGHSKKNAVTMANDVIIAEGLNEAIGTNKGVWAPGGKGNGIQIAVPGVKE
jgi:hypothetical protein